jgi:hypothetical protein
MEHTGKTGKPGLGEIMDADKATRLHAAEVVAAL